MTLWEYFDAIDKYEIYIYRGWIFDANILRRSWSLYYMASRYLKAWLFDKRPARGNLEISSNFGRTFWAKLVSHLFIWTYYVLKKYQSLEMWIFSLRGSYFIKQKTYVFELFTRHTFSELSTFCSFKSII